MNLFTKLIFFLYAMLPLPQNKFCFGIFGKKEIPGIKKNFSLKSRLELDLFQFAAEDEGRTEDPTARRIKEARDKGQVAKSAELPQALTLLMGFLSFYFLSVWILYKMMMLTVKFFSDFWLYTFYDIELLNGFWFVLFLFAKIISPILAITFIAGILGNVVQFGFLFTVKPIIFDLSKIKIDPASFLKKVLFSKQVAMNLFKALFKVTIIGCLSYVIIASDFEKLMKTSQVTPMESLFVIGFVVFKLIIWSSLLLLLLSIPDFFFQKKELKESLKMTKQELKQEIKEYEGDPYIKARLRARRQEMQRNKMIADLPAADIVITNPVHIAVALQYSPSSGAPLVIAKGEGYLARKIKEIAVSHNIKIIENKPLAWELYKVVEIGQEIPDALYRVVAEIFKLLIEKDPQKFSHLVPA